MKIDKAVWEYKRAVGKPFTGDLRQMLWEGLDVGTKSMIMQNGFQSFDYKALCSEILGSEGCCVFCLQRCGYGGVEP